MDIDVDFEFARREDVITYCKNKYGIECVSRIITFGTMAAKSSVLDMARVLNKPLSLSNAITKLIPSEPGMTIKKAMLSNPELANLYNSNDDAKEIIDLAKQVEGLIKNTSCHACGVIIAPSDITDYCPQTFAYDEETNTVERTTQYTMGECEEIGLLKMDFLGLRTESVIKESIEDIAKYHGIQLNSYDINSIPLNDLYVYGYLLGKGLTEGCFQLESDGLTSVIKQLFEDVEDKIKEIENNPLLTEEGKKLEKDKFGNQCFERLIAGISLYRPGPMDEIPKYIHGMKDESTIVYECEELEPILKNTYGVIVYQEQVMQIVRALAGFSAGQSDTIRKGMGKKKQDILDEYRPFFINGSGNAIDSHTNQPYNIKGCVANGISEKIAESIWEKMDTFAKYAFNKSHAAAYAVVSIQTAWLAYYYPVIFMKANLNVYKGNPKKLKYYLNYCHKADINVLPPSVNSSDIDFTLNDDASAIVFGLSGIKNVGKISRYIIEERNLRGKFSSFQNFIERMLKYWKINGRAIESLANVGAFDCFGGSRKSKVDYANAFIETVKKDKALVYPGHSTIFEMADEIGLSNEVIEMKNIIIPNSDIEFDDDVLLSLEEEFAGFYLSGHPLDKYEILMKRHDFKEISTILEEMPTENITIAGILGNVEKRLTGKGDTFATMQIKGRTEDVRAVAWPKIYTDFNEKIRENAKVLVTGTLENSEDFGPQFMILSIVDLDELKREVQGLQVISSHDIDKARQQYVECYNLMTSHSGNMRLLFCTPNQVYEFPYGDWSCDLLNQLQDIFGEDNVKYLINE